MPGWAQGPSSVSPPHLSCSANGSRVVWAQSRDQMQERGIVSAGRAERKNVELPKSCEQVVGSGWVPWTCSESGWGRQAHFPSVHQAC